MSEALDRKLAELNGKLERLTSPWWALFLSILRGIGFTVGASVIAGILLAVLSQAFRTVEDVPILRDLVERIQESENIE